MSPHFMLPKLTLIFLVGWLVFVRDVLDAAMFQPIRGGEVVVEASLLPVLTESHPSNLHNSGFVNLYLKLRREEGRNGGREESKSG